MYTIIIRDLDTKKGFKLLGFSKEGAEYFVKWHLENNAKCGIHREYEIQKGKKTDSVWTVENVWQPGRSVVDHDPKNP